MFDSFTAQPEALGLHENAALTRESRASEALLAGSLAASIPKLLALRAVSQWIPPISGAVLVVIGGLSLVSRLT